MLTFVNPRHCSLRCNNTNNEFRSVLKLHFVKIWLYVKKVEKS